MMLGSDSDNTVQARITNFSNHTRTERNWVLNSPLPASEENTSGWTIAEILMDDPNSFGFRINVYITPPIPLRK